MRRQLWVLWVGMLLSMLMMSTIILVVLPRIMQNPIRPPEDPLLRWMRWGFIGLVFGTWLFGVWAVQKARRLGAAGISPAVGGPSSEPHPAIQWSIAGWSALEGGVVVDLVYWLLSQDWGNTLPALLIHGLTFLASNPLYIAGQAPRDLGVR